MTFVHRHNVHVTGTGSKPMIFAHGYGCDQNMWRYLTPAFQSDYKIILFDHIGHGRSSGATFDRSKYAALDGFADDLIGICEELDLTNAIFVGHSVSAMIGILAAIKAPKLFDRLILIGPSPRYVNDGDYFGGFEKADIDGLLDFLDSNHLGWSATMAPVIMGNADRPALREELANSFCSTDPDVAKSFARVTFLSDNRADLAKLDKRCLILQCSEDAIAPLAVGQYVHSQLADSELVLMDATGHCPNLSAPDETIRAIRSFLDKTN